MRMLVAPALSLALLVAAASDARAGACAAPASGVEVTRTSTLVWEICATSPAGPVRWVLDGAAAPAPPDPRAEVPGGDGVRIRALYWTDPTGAEHELLACGNCDLIEAVRLPGTSALTWTGPGYGMGRPLEPSASLDLPIGVPALADAFELRQVVVQYAPGEPVALGSLRRPVAVREHEITISQAGANFYARVLAVDSLELGLAYHARPEATSTCQGGLFNGYATALGEAWTIPDCAPGPNRYTYPPAQSWVEMTSSLAPVRVRFTSDADQPWVCLQNRSQEGKLKCYGRPVSAFGSPVPISKGEARTFGHTIEVLP